MRFGNVPRVTGQEAVRKRATEWMRDYDNYTPEYEAGQIILALLDERAALVAERDAANEKLRIAACDLEIFQSRAEQAVAERDRNQRKVDAYDSARAVVKIEGNSRAYYVLRAENAEEIAEQVVAERDRYRDTLDEIESFPVSGYHAGAAQRIARAALAVSTP